MARGRCEIPIIKEKETFVCYEKNPAKRKKKRKTNETATRYGDGGHL